MICWTDTHEIAIALEDAYPDVDILQFNFAKLQAMVQALSNFDAGSSRVNERTLEAIQMAWLDERDD